MAFSGLDGKAELLRFVPADDIPMGRELLDQLPDDAVGGQLAWCW